MKLDIISPSGIACSAEVSKVFLPGEVGPFEVLKSHAPIITNLVRGTVSFEQEGEMKRIEIVGGFAKVENDHIVICIEGENEA